MSGHRRQAPGAVLVLLAMAGSLSLALPQRDAGLVPPQDTGAPGSQEARVPAPFRPDLVDRLVDLGGMPSPTGEEAPLRGAVADALAAAGAAPATDGLGNLLVGLPAAPVAASGSRPLLVLLPLDDPTYAVSAVEEEGWLRLTALARPGPPPDLHAHLAGSSVWVMGQDSATPGVLALPSIHLQHGRDGFPPAAGEERLFVDVGADSPGAVAALGIDRLDRVVPRMLPARLAGGRVAGFGLGRRAAAAALVEAAGRKPGLPPVALVAQSRFGARGLEALRPLLVAMAEAGGAVVLIEPAETGGDFWVVPSVPVTSTAPAPGPESGFSPGARALADSIVAAMAQASVAQRTFVVDRPDERGRGSRLRVPLPDGVDGVSVRFPVDREGTLGETVDVRTVVALADLLGALARRPGGGPAARRDAAAPGGVPRWAVAAGDGNGPEARPWEAPVRIFPADPTQPFAHLPALIEAAGVSGAEEEVRATVRRLLPSRYAGQARQDSSGNLLLDIGEGSPHLLFVAHLDETGYRVAAIDADGRLQVQKRGGFYDSAVVNRPVWVHRSGQAPADGILVLLPEEASPFEPEPAVADASAPGGGDATPPATTPPAVDMEAPPLVEVLPAVRLRVDLATASATGTAALGIAVGDSVTVRKQLQPLGEHRAAGRAVDDRAGCAALLAVLHRLARSPAGERGLTGRVTFAWVTREEIGLQGATELAGRLRPDLVFAVDTFVSSDSPLERRYFARAPLGQGAVLRAADTSNLTPLSLVRAVRRAAAAAGIPVQSGVGRGGNDGSVFARHGAPDLPLSWPGRYSHSAVEVIDSKDLDALADLILLLVTESDGIQAK